MRVAGYFKGFHMKRKGSVSTTKRSGSSSRGLLRGRSPLIKGVSGEFPLYARATRKLPEVLPFKTPHIDIRSILRRTQGVERSQPMRSTLNPIKICKDRHMRREVLFALKRTNGSASKVYTEKSKVRC